MREDAPALVSAKPFHPLKIPSEAFDFEAVYDAIDGDTPDQEADKVVASLQDERIKLTRDVLALVEKLVLVRDRQGQLPEPRALAVRWFVFRVVLGLDQPKSLGSAARHLGVTRAWLNKLCRQTADALGVPSPYGRSEGVREACVERAKGVHAGTWVSTPKAERDRLRRQRAATRAA